MSSGGEEEIRVDGLEIADRLAKHVRTLETWYSTEFERRMNEMAKILRAELQVQMEEVRVQYEDCSRALQEKLKTGPSLGQGSLEHVLKEIARVEADASRCTADLERMVADDSVAIGRLLQIRTQELELKAYLRGLNFQAGVEPQKPPKF
jgi:hypothetical protein